MINNVNSTPSFGSTFIPIKNSNVKLSEMVGNLPKYFELKGRFNIPAQKAADEIDFGQAAVILQENGATFVGKDKTADRFIAKIMKKFHPDAKFTDDIKDIEISGPIIDLNI